MRELWPIVIFGMAMALLAERHSVYERGDLGEKRYLKKDIFFFTVMAIALAVFVGLRTRYNDTITYRGGYEALTGNWSDINKIDWALGSNPGFAFVNICLRSMGASAQSFLMFYALITICIYIWFIRKYTDNLWLSVFIFFAECYTFPMAAIKQCVAVAFCLVATDRAIRRKWIPFILWVLLASTFHPYSLMYLIVPFLTFAPWSRKSYWMLLIFGALGLGLQPLLGTVVDITTMMGEVYTEAEFSGTGVNIWRFLVVSVPVLLSFLARNFLKNSENKTDNIIVNLTILRAEIMFVALFGTANYFARLANYFYIFPVISIPYLFRFYEKQSRTFLFVAAVVLYFIYFYYSNAVMYGGFDYLYSRVSLLQYLHSLFG